MTKGALIVSCIFLATLVHGQAGTGSCSEELSKSEGDNHRIRISTGVSEGLIVKKSLPDIADLKGTRLHSTVVVRALVDKHGIVRCTDPVSGDANLIERSLHAAQQWRFKPFLLNGDAMIVETPIEFVFKKNKVNAR